MTTELVPFNGGEIRTIEHEQQTVAYMPDVAKTFGLRAARRQLRGSLSGRQGEVG